jgi:Tfp pilus assembly protein PilF
MKKKLASLLGIIVFSLFFFSGQAQDKTIKWTTKSKKARELALQGAKLAMNAEIQQAYDYFNSALKLDPDYTFALVFMAQVTSGATKKDYSEKAIKSASNKSEGEKLYASTVAPGITPETNRQAAAKLYEMYPGEKMFGLNYVFSRATPEEGVKAAEEFLKKFPDDPPINNSLGYMNIQVKKDTAAARRFFEKYIQLYPEGCNPYDSMGEFYFMTGDMDNSEKYYNMALEKYPFNISSIDKLKEIKAIKDKKK